MKVDPQALPRMRRQRLRAHRLARLGLAQMHRVGAGAGVAEIMIESHDAVDFRARQVQPFRDHGNSASRNEAQRGLYSVQHFQERTGASLVLGNDAPYDGTLRWR